MPWILVLWKAKATWKSFSYGAVLRERKPPVQTFTKRIFYYNDHLNWKFCRRVEKKPSKNKLINVKTFEYKRYLYNDSKINIMSKNVCVPIKYFGTAVQFLSLKFKLCQTPQQILNETTQIPNKYISESYLQITINRIIFGNFLEGINRN